MKGLGSLGISDTNFATQILPEFEKENFLLDRQLKLLHHLHHGS
jgi:hypothetical protein